MRKRKTIEVAYVKDSINKLLALDTISQDQKKALSFILEKVLIEAAAYDGFEYLFDWNATSPTERNAMRYNRKYF